MMYPKSNSYLPSKCLRLTPLLSFDVAKVRRFSQIRNIFISLFMNICVILIHIKRLCANTTCFLTIFV